MGAEMEALKSLGAGLLGIAGFAVMLLLGVFFIYGATWFSLWAIPYMTFATDIAVAVCIFILLPLALFRRTRPASAYGFMLCSFVFGICLWMYGLLITMSIWGPVAVIVGLMLGGIGVVPIGMLACVFHGEWLSLTVLLVGTVLTYLARYLSLRIATRADADEYERQSRIIEGTVVR
jgi:hypothetical protein